VCNPPMPATDALLFPGQGSQHPGMDEPHRGSPLFERGLELLGYDPFERLDAGTRYHQPALFLCSAAELDAWDGDLSQVVAAAGHSLGEYCALYAACALQFDDALRLVDARAAAMADAAKRNPGSMVAMLGGDDHAVRALAASLGLTVANDNAPGQLVLSGALGAIAAAEERAGETGARARRLDVGGAFHSPLMQPAAAKLAAALERTPIESPRFPVYSNGSAAPFADIRRELSENLLKPVRFRETLLALRAAGADRYVELGPGQVLTGLVKRTLRSVEAAV
jgi:[acyl-carrier-protein] S-malonyltransferase